MQVGRACLLTVCNVNLSLKCKNSLDSVGKMLPIGMFY